LAKRKRNRIFAFLVFGLIGALLIAVYLNFFVISNNKVQKAKETEIPEWVDKQIIHKHSTARTGILLDDIKNIVIHYVGNPNTSAKNNRDYFNKPSTGVSSHFIVGLGGEVIQCVPIYERSAASNDRNKDTL
jgi:N-acetyl-anhydromuramyl-L-alanine amidase AmpD